MVLWGLRTTHMDKGVYVNPDAFDPSRFSEERAEHRRHEHAYVPNGAGSTQGHKCAGYEFAPLFLQTFLIELCAHDVVIAQPQDLSYDWSRIPPEPKEGLRAVVMRKGARLD
jgi:cytochrome P450